MITALAAAAALLAGPPPTDAHPIVVGDRRLSRGFLRHWADIAQRSQDGMPRAEARSLAGAMLISSRWIAGEASERGVVVTREEVDREFRKLRNTTFPRRRDYRKFLRESGQTGTDVRFRVRIDLQSDRLRAVATEGASTPQEQVERLDAFVIALHAKWRARTVCRRPWIAEGCGGTTNPRRTASAPERQLLPDVDRIAAGAR